MIVLLLHLILIYFFFFNDTATTEIYTLSLHDALPISWCWLPTSSLSPLRAVSSTKLAPGDRKSTRLNSSHGSISYALFCLKKKKNGRIDGQRHAAKCLARMLTPPPT